MESIYCKLHEITGQDCEFPGLQQKFAVRGYQGEKFSLPFPLIQNHSQDTKQASYNTTKTSMTTENIEDYVKYDEKHGVLICIPHGSSLVPGEGIGRHFQQYHGSIPIGTRKKITEYAETLALTDPDDIGTPDPGDGTIKGLKLEENGFCCTHDDCDGYFSAKESTMIKHCQNAHKTNDKMWRKQAVQTFFAGITFFYLI